MVQGFLSAGAGLPWQGTNALELVVGGPGDGDLDVVAGIHWLEMLLATNTSSRPLTSAPEWGAGKGLVPFPACHLSP